MRKASTRLRALGLPSLIPKMTLTDLSYDYKCLRISPDGTHAGARLNREHLLQCCPTKSREMIKPSTATELHSCPSRSKCTSSSQRSSSSQCPSSRALVASAMGPVAEPQQQQQPWVQQQSLRSISHRPSSRAPAAAAMGPAAEPLK